MHLPVIFQSKKEQIYELSYLPRDLLELHKIPRYGFIRCNYLGLVKYQVLSMCLKNLSPGNALLPEFDECALLT